MTGATGFLGFTLLNKLYGDGHKITILTRATTSLTQIKKLSDNFNIIFLTNESLNESLESKLLEAGHFDLIIHAATDYNRIKNIYSPLFANVNLPIFLLNFAIKHNVLKFINFDTFFNNDQVSFNYLGEYVITKKFFCDYGALACQNSKGITFLNLKIFHMYGPRDRDDKFISYVLSMCSKGENLQLTNGIQKRDFIFVDDVVSATKIVADTTFLPGFYNFDVGTGESTSIRELVILINRLCGNRSILNFGALSDRLNELTDSKANTLALNKLGWHPAIKLEVGLKKIVKGHI